MEELKFSKYLIIRQEENLHPPSNSEIFENGLQRDPEGIVRCNDRLQNAGPEFRSVFLSYVSHLVFLLLFFFHKKFNAHCGAQQMLSLYREEHWTPRARNKARQIVKSICNWCKRERAKLYTYPPIMPPLPTFRISKNCPYVSVGVDMFGALSVRCHGIVCKVYVALYSCLLSRHTHLEICEDLSAASFIRSFRRFCSRRGQPLLLISDNASGFIMAKEILAQAWNPVNPSSSVIRYMTEHNIKWKTIPALSPHFGATWERTVGIIKGPLERALGRRIVTLEELHSILCEAEFLANARPVTYLYQQESALVLRPTDLVQPLQPTYQPFLSNIWDNDENWMPRYDLKDKVLKTWADSNRILKTFWDLFRTEYLNYLRERTSLFPKQSGSTGNFPQTRRSSACKSSQRKK